MPQDKNELLQELIAKYARMYMKYACRNGVPYDDAEDIVMDAFWAFYRSEYFGNLSEEETKAMIARIVKNRCIDFYRKNRHVEMTGIEDSVSELEIISRLSQNDPVNVIIGEEYRSRILGFMNEMNESLRDTAALYFVEERTYEEICEILGISDAACRTRISRVRKILKDKISKMN